MATITWIGGTDTDAATAGNWDTGGVPGSVICASLDVSKAATINASGATILMFNDGAYDFTNSYVKINSASDTSLNTSTTGMFASAAARAYMTFTMMSLGTSSSAGLKFDDGVYPNISLNAGSAAYLLPTYLAPNNTYGKVDMSSLTIAANVTASMTGVTVVENDYAKVFHIRGALTIASNSFDMGYSTVHFTGAAHPNPLSIPMERLIYLKPLSTVLLLRLVLMPPIMF